MIRNDDGTVTHLMVVMIDAPDEATADFRRRLLADITTPMLMRWHREDGRVASYEEQLGRARKCLEIEFARLTAVGEVER